MRDVLNGIKIKRKELQKELRLLQKAIAVLDGEIDKSQLIKTRKKINS